MKQAFFCFPNRIFFGIHRLKCRGMDAAPNNLGTRFSALHIGAFGSALQHEKTGLVFGLREPLTGRPCRKCNMERHWCRNRDHDRAPAYLVAISGCWFDNGCFNNGIFTYSAFTKNLEGL